MVLDTRKQHLARWGALQTERSSWWSHYKELSTYLRPRAGKFFLQDTNNGRKKHGSIYDGTGERALRIQSAGLFGGMTSPARPWFRLATPDTKLNDSYYVKVWLTDVTRTMLSIFAKSNAYRALHTMYSELGAFGTSTSILAADYKNVIHTHNLTVGDYCLATDWQGNVNTMYREFQKTVSQVVREFGYKNCSLSVRNMFDNKQLDQYVPIMHIIEPRDDRDTAKKDSLNMRFKSCYFEMNSNEEMYLRESGYKNFPCLAPRWDVQNGSDVYGSSPGMVALGNLKQLQHQQMRKAMGIDYMTKPPLQAPAGFKDQDINMMPGGVSFVMGADGSGIKNAFETRLDLSHLLNDIQDVRRQVNDAFSVDMFLMLSEANNGRITATEVAERHEEKMLMLGPVLDRQHNELLAPYIEYVFDQMVAADLVPPPPEELNGMELSVEFVSVLAQAQRAVSTNSMDRFVSNLGIVAKFKPDVLDKLDADEWADKYSDMLGVDPDILIANDKVAIIRQQKQQALAQAQQVAQAEQMASAAQKAGSVQTQGGTSNMAIDMLNQFSGYGSPTGVGL
jgi:hypothetical protein